MPLKDPDARREYQRTYQRERWYPANRELHRRRVRAADARRHAPLLLEVDELKRRPCGDCGQTYPPVCMDFDHRGEDPKLANVAHLLRRGYAIARIRAEIAKCDVICSNCHRIRTAARRAALL